MKHSLYVGVVKKLLPHHSQGEQYGKMELKYPDGGHCQSVLRPQGIFDVPLYFLIIHAVETATPFNVVSHPR